MKPKFTLDKIKQINVRNKKLGNIQLIIQSTLLIITIIILINHPSILAGFAVGIFTAMVFTLIINNYSDSLKDDLISDLLKNLNTTGG